MINNQAQWDKHTDRRTLQLTRFSPAQHSLNVKLKKIKSFKNCDVKIYWLNDILTFMATLLSKDLVKFSELNLDFSNLIFVSCFKLSKMYSPSDFFKDGLKLYAWDHITTPVFSKYFFLFSSLNSRMSWNICFFVTNCVMLKRASVQLLHGQMNLDI